eukprot:m.179861 g.179861  ORF g.179861 m.179861 type:complete len:837 (+) comp18001_c0_seq7:632-3142(+)
MAHSVAVVAIAALLVLCTDEVAAFGQRATRDESTTRIALATRLQQRHVAATTQPAQGNDISALQARLRTCMEGLPNSQQTLEATTLLVSEMFQQYAAYDAANRNITARIIAAFHRRKTPNADDVAEAKRQPILEMNRTRDILSDAISFCEKGTAHRPTLRPVPSSVNLNSASGYFDSGDDGKPYFFSGYNEEPTPGTPANVSELGIAFFSVSFDPANVLHSSIEPDPAKVATIVQKLDQLVAVGGQTQIFLGNGREGSAVAPEQTAMPKWASDQYPELVENVGTTHFFGYDIDHPMAAKLWNATLSGVIPAITSKKEYTDHILFVSMANEPGFKRANSTFTFAKFKTQLQAWYKGSLPKLKAAWNITGSLSGWDDPHIAQGMGYKDFSDQQQIDWQTFNMNRVTSWFSNMCNMINAHTTKGIPLRCGAKYSNGGSGLATWLSGGLDRVALAAIPGVADCDTRILYSNESHDKFPQYPVGDYSVDWLGQAASMDFMKTVPRPKKPVFDAEWHSVSTVGYRNADLPLQYMTCATIFAFSHGLASDQMWYWGRDGTLSRPKFSSEFFGADFAMSILTQPQVLNGYVRAHTLANAFATELAALASADSQIQVMYSSLASTVDAQHRNTQLSTYAALHWLGVNVGYLPERDVGSGVAQVPSVLVVPAVPFASDETVEALRKAVAARTSLVVVTSCDSSSPANTFSKDLRGAQREPAKLAWLKDVPVIQFPAMANETALRQVEHALQSHLTPLLRCHDGQGKASYGVYCRSAAATLAPSSTSSSSSSSSTVLLLQNLRSTPQTVYVTQPSGQHLKQAINLLTGAEISFPWTMQPLDTALMVV